MAQQVVERQGRLAYGEMPQGLRKRVYELMFSSNLSLMEASERLSVPPEVICSLFAKLKMPPQRTEPKQPIGTPLVKAARYERDKKAAMNRWNAHKQVNWLRTKGFEVLPIISPITNNPSPCIFEVNSLRIIVRSLYSSYTPKGRLQYQLQAPSGLYDYDLVIFRTDNEDCYIYPASHMLGVSSTRFLPDPCSKPHCASLRADWSAYHERWDLLAPQKEPNI